MAPQRSSQGARVFRGESGPPAWLPRHLLREPLSARWNLATLPDGRRLFDLEPESTEEEPERLGVWYSEPPEDDWSSRRIGVPTVLIGGAGLALQAGNLAGLAFVNAAAVALLFPLCLVVLVMAFEPWSLNGERSLARMRLPREPPPPAEMRKLLYAALDAEGVRVKFRTERETSWKITASPHLWFEYQIPDEGPAVLEAFGGGERSRLAFHRIKGALALTLGDVSGALPAVSPTSAAGVPADLQEFAMLRAEGEGRSPAWNASDIGDRSVPDVNGLRLGELPVTATRGFWVSLPSDLEHQLRLSSAASLVFFAPVVALVAGDAFALGRDLTLVLGAAAMGAGLAVARKRAFRNPDDTGTAGLWIAHEDGAWEKVRTAIAATGCAVVRARSEAGEHSARLGERIEVSLTPQGSFEGRDARLAIRLETRGTKLAPLHRRLKGEILARVHTKGGAPIPAEGDRRANAALGVAWTEAPPAGNRRRPPALTGLAGIAITGFFAVSTVRDYLGGVDPTTSIIETALIAAGWILMYRAGVRGRADTRWSATTIERPVPRDGRGPKEFRRALKRALVAEDPTWRRLGDDAVYYHPCGLLRVSVQDMDGGPTLVRITNAWGGDRHVRLAAAVDEAVATAGQTEGPG